MLCASCGQPLAAEALFCPACGTPRARGGDGDPLMGAVLGERFLVVERIGHGTSGTIYRGEHVTLRRKVAIKVLHQELARDELAVERFRREAITVGEIDNDHIVEIHDFGRTPDGRLYLAMELLEGETLQERLRRDRQLAVDSAVDILVQLGEALMEAHAMGYVHRDLRPRNIYLCVRRGRADFVKLLDFGLAKLVKGDGAAESTSLGMTFGDPRYMAPEQARGEILDRRADIYSLGCIAYEMLAGQPPFASGKTFDILAQQLDAAPLELRARRPDVPSWLSAVVMRMLAKRADDRFTTVYLVVEALRHGHEARPAPAATETGSARAAEASEDAPAQLSGRTIRIGVPMVPPAEPAAAPAPESEPGSEPGSEPDGRADAPVPPDAEAEPAQHDASEPAGGESGEDNEDAADEDEAAPAEDSRSGISHAWFADGEGGEDQPERPGRARESVAPVRAGTDDDEFYEPERRPLGKIAAIVGGAVAVIVVLALAWPSGHKEPAPATTAEPPPSSAAATLAALDDPDAAPAPADAGVADAAAEPAEQAAGATEPGRTAAGSSATSRSNRPSGERTSGERSSTPRVDRTPGGSSRPPADEPREAPESGAATGSEAANQAGFFANMGQLDLGKGEVGSAAGHFNKALELDPRNVKAIVGLGEIALQTGSYSAAISHLRKAARISPKDANVHTLLGEAYLGSGNDSQAATSFKQALKLNPDSARARNGYNEAAGRIPPPPEDP